jgi:hypothetical protein
MWRFAPHESLSLLVIARKIFKNFTWSKQRYKFEAYLNLNMHDNITTINQINPRKFQD